jgi:hypothetical protein
VLLGGLVFLLLSAGIWETATYSIYMDGVTRATQGDLRGAIRQMQAARDADPNMPVTLANLALLQDMQGQHEEARVTACRWSSTTPLRLDASLSVLQKPAFLADPTSSGTPIGESALRTTYDRCRVKIVMPLLLLTAPSTSGSPFPLVWSVIRGCGRIRAMGLSGIAIGE